MTGPAPAVEVSHLTKRFLGVVALHDVSFEVAPGTTVAVVGENGAGKSTLMSILAGLRLPDGGDVRIAGERVERFAPEELLRRHRVALVPQELVGCGELSVARNVLLGVEPGSRAFPSRRRLLRRAHDVLADLDPDLDPRAPFGDIRVADRQLVVIARALARDCRVLILDEPTAVLTPEETERLFAVVRRFQAEGGTVLYVSHRLDEVFALAGVAHILRDGALVRTLDVATATPSEIVRAMVGRELAERSKPAAVPTSAAFRVHGLSGIGFENVSLEVGHGETLGLAGLPDSGRSELLASIFGASPPRSGRVELEGRPLTASSPARAIRAGIAYVPAERRSQGILASMDVAANVAVLQLGRISRFGFVSHRRLRGLAAEQVTRFDVRTRGPQQGIQELSGGNQQKVIMARWMALQPRLMLLDEPTRGIDVGGKSDIYDLLEELTDAGSAAIVSSSELPELLRICDRIAVMRRGRLIGVLAARATGEEEIMALATGIKEEAV